MASAIAGMTAEYAAELGSKTLTPHPANQFRSRADSATEQAKYDHRKPNQLHNRRIHRGESFASVQGHAWGDAFLARAGLGKEGEVNSNTREDLKEFAAAVQTLAAGCVHMIGMETAGEIINKCEKLIKQLDKDETII